MNITVDTSGLDALRERLAAARAALPDLLQEAAVEAGEWIVQNLHDAAPVGPNEGGPPPEGDGPGRLADSFYVQEESSAYSPGGAITVRTTQPTKLKFVTEGRGEVLPKVKRALFWPGLTHPVRRAGPSEPNDFVEVELQSMPDESDVLSVVVEQIAEILEG